MRIFRYWLEFLVLIPFTVLTIVTFLQVLFRYVFQYPAYWTQDVVSISFIWSIFLGSALAVRNGDHIVVDIIDRVPESIRKVIVFLGAIGVMVFLALLTYYGYQHAINSMNQIIPSLNMPRGYVYLVVPFSGILMIYYMLRNLLRLR